MNEARDRSTLLTSPRSQADFGVRLVFFALAPVGIVRIAAFFPVGGTLATIALALVGFVAGEAIRSRAARWPTVAKWIGPAFGLEAFYRMHPPRPFAYYVLYPVLFPYWLLQREARREFWLFKGYTLMSFIVLLVSVAWQYFVYWPPELGLREFTPVILVTLGVETILVLSLLMPIATTVVGFHQSMRRRRLVALLLVGVVSTGIAVGRLAIRRDPIVSYSTRQRVRLRTKAAPERAADAHLAALQAAWPVAREQPGVIEPDGKILGEPLERAHQALESFYRRDEAFAFDLWGSPPEKPELLVVYVEGRGGKPPIWLAMDANGETIRDASTLPKAAFKAMKLAAEN